MRRIGRLPAWTALVALLALSVALRAWGALSVPSPWIVPDEVVYAELGRNLFASGTLGVLGEPVSFYTLVYPVLIGLPLSIGDVGVAYALTKALQAVVMSLAAVPVYLWGRSLMTHRWALLAAALTLAVPGLAYSGLLMTEVAFYPVLVLAAWAMARALVQPTTRNQALMLSAFALAAATRLQAVVLVPAFLTALALDAAFTRSTGTARRFGPALLGLVLAAVAWSAWQLRDGGSWSELLAAYQAAGETTYHPGEAAKFVAYHAGDLVLLAGVFPVCAVALLALEAARGGETSAAVRAYVAVAASLAVWLVVEVGVFASAHVERLAERDLLAVSPVLFLGFCIWLARGAPRPQWRTGAVVLLAAAAVLTIPVKDFVTVFGLQDAFGIVPLFRLLERNEDAAIDIVLWGVVAVALVLFAVLPRRAVAVLPALLLVWLVTASVIVSDEVIDQARARERTLLGAEPRWVDRARTPPVAYVYDGEPSWSAVWAHLFWNRELKAVYALPGTQVPGPLPQEPLAVLPDGGLARVDRGHTARFLVGPTTIRFAGNPVAETRQEGLTHAGLVLWKLDNPPRLSTQTVGVLANGDLNLHGQLVAYGCREGTFELQVFAKGNRKVEIRVNGETVQRLTLADGQAWGSGLPVRGNGGQCSLEIRADGLVGTTQLEFKR